MPDPYIVRIHSGPVVFADPVGGPGLLLALQEKMGVGGGVPILPRSQVDAGAVCEDFMEYEDRIGEFLARAGSLLKDPVEVVLSGEHGESRFWAGPSKEGIEALRKQRTLERTRSVLAEGFSGEEIERFLGIATSVLLGRAQALRPVADQPQAGEGAYFRTQLLVEVISEDEPAQDMGLSSLAECMDTGDLVGQVSLLSQERLTPEQAARALEKVGSDASFFESLPELLEEGPGERWPRLCIEQTLGAMGESLESEAQDEGAPAATPRQRPAG